MESILNSIKKLLGIPADVTDFDADVIMHINSVLSMLPQICPELPDGFFIQNADDEWNDYIPDRTKTEFVKTYIYLKVRLVFDPPTGGVLDAMKASAQELEWRLSITDNV